MARPYAYLRKSRVFRDRNSISPEMQLAEVQAIASRHGDSDLIVLQDMNVSGKKGRAARPGFRELLEAVEGGEVSAIYSYSLSRLSRSLRDVIDLAEMCAAKHVPIRLAVDPDPDPTSPSGKLILTILAAMAQFEADVASERARDTVEVRRARGDTFGGPVFADHQRVIDAFMAAGSCTGAARLLTMAGVKTRNGNDLWYPSAVRVILQRTAPHLLPKGQPRGTKAAAPFIFYRLVRCHCGHVMTGWRRASGPMKGYVLYRCTRGRLNPLHGKTTIPETRLLAWAMEEAQRLRPPQERVAMAESTEAEQTALRERLNRLRVAFLAGLVGETEMLAEKQEIDEAITRLDLQGQAVRVPGVTWALDQPVALNRALRALWEPIQLDGNLRPASVTWLLPPEWLAPRERE